LKLNEILHDPDFAATFAAGQEFAYYNNRGLTPPVFESQSTSAVLKSRQNQQIALQLTSFYAVESGIVALCERHGQTPVFWLQQILSKQLSAEETLLLNRFANVTWKTGRIFSGLHHMQEDDFHVADLMPVTDVQRAAKEMASVATLLLEAMKPASTSPLITQFEHLQSLLKDRSFSIQMAEHIFSSKIELPSPDVIPEPFWLPEEENQETERSEMEEKIAINLVAFFALDGALSYFLTVQDKLPSITLASILDGSIRPIDKRLFERFANVAWKASQPFRGLERIEKEDFTVFDLLPAGEVEKDWVQIKTAATSVLKQWKG